MMAYAFLKKSDLDLDKGSEKLVIAVAQIVHDLGLPVPAKTQAQGAGVA